MNNNNNDANVISTPKEITYSHVSYCEFCLYEDVCSTYERMQCMADLFNMFDADCLCDMNFYLNNGYDDTEDIEEQEQQHVDEEDIYWEEMSYYNGHV